MRRTVILNVVGLTQALVDSGHMPKLSDFFLQGQVSKIRPTFPAVTCTAQATYLTGLAPCEHGIVGNGWYDRSLAEVHFWKQSNHLVSGRKLWEKLRDHDSSFTCAQLFWWYNMYASVDYSITPRPMYPADGRKIFDIYTGPLAIRSEIKKDLGEFPFSSFWGPLAGIDSSQWIADAARWMEERHHPTLSLVYLPHLDYNLQRLGPNDSKIQADLRQMDELVGELMDFFQKQSVQIAILSEYGITEVDGPIHLNRLFRQNGWITIKEELGLEQLDCGASKVFAVADHQIAHIYINDPLVRLKVRTVLEAEAGVQRVLDRAEQVEWGIQHPRSGDLIAIAKARNWFTYYYWHDDDLAPDFARCIDIHRKIGYDPVELFMDPKLGYPQLRVATFLLRKKLGFRALLDVIPLDASLVRGSHGRHSEDENNWPILCLEKQHHLECVVKTLGSEEVHEELLQYCRRP